MTELKTLFVSLENLQDLERVITKVRFGVPDSCVQSTELQLTPLVGFQGETLGLVQRNKEQTLHFFSSPFTLGDACLQALDAPPVLQDDGYYHLTQAQFLFLCGCYANIALIDHIGYSVMQPILKQMSTVSVTVDTGVQDDAWGCPLYIVYTVTDSEIQEVVSAFGEPFTTELLPQS